MIQPSKSVSRRCLIDWFTQFAFIPESGREIRGNLAKLASIFSSKLATTFDTLHLKLLQQTNTPQRLWSYLGQWVAAVRRLTAHEHPNLDGRVPAEAIEGQTPDISEYAIKK